MLKEAPIHSYKVITDRPKAEVVESFKLDHPGCTVMSAAHNYGVLIIEYTKRHEVEAAERENEECRQRLKAQPMAVTKMG